MVKEKLVYCPSCGKQTTCTVTGDGIRCQECLTTRRLEKYSTMTRLVLFLKEEYGFNSAQVRYICTKKLGITENQIHNKVNRYVKDCEIEDADRTFRFRKIKQKLKEQDLI